MAGQAHPGEADGAAVGVVVVGQGIDRDRGAGSGRHAVGHGDRRGIARRHGDRDVGGADTAPAVANGVGEAVDAAEARLGRVADLLVRLDLDGPVPWGVDPDDAERVTVGIVVVGQNSNGDAVAGEHLGDIVARVRRGVRPGDGDRHLSRGRPTQAVAHRVGEVVAADETRRRGVGEALVGIEGQRPEGRHRVADDAQSAAGIVAEDVDHDRRPEQGTRGIVLGCRHEQAPSDKANSVFYK